MINLIRLEATELISQELGGLESGNLGLSHDLVFIICATLGKE